MPVQVHVAPPASFSLPRLDGVQLPPPGRLYTGPLKAAAQTFEATLSSARAMAMAPVVDRHRAGRSPSAAGAPPCATAPPLGRDDLMICTSASAAPPSVVLALTTTRA